ncbi:MAG: hypothetical protein L3K00_03180 [Thermoplasmata archaeon]|nr:hypothetical protein [Thermoplasmata archaeon]
MYGPLTPQERYDLHPRGLHGAFFLPHKNFESWMFNSDPQLVAILCLAFGLVIGVLFTYLWAIGSL